MGPQCQKGSLAALPGAGTMLALLPGQGLILATLCNNWLKSVKAERH